MKFSDQIHAPAVNMLGERDAGSHWARGWEGHREYLNALDKRQHSYPRPESNQSPKVSKEMPP